MNKVPDMYAVVGPLRIDDISAVQPDIVLGFPSPTAVAGFGYRVCLEVNRELGRSAVEFMGAAVVVHEHSVQDGHAKHPPNDPDKIRNGKGAPTIDEFRGRVVLSFVVAVGSLAAEKDARDADFTAMKAQLEASAPGIFFGGGKAFLPDGVKRSDVVKMVLPAHLEDHLRAMRPGHVLGDRRDLLEDRVAEAGCDPLDGMLDLLEFFPFDEGGEPRPLTTEEREGLSKGKRVETKRRLPGWIVPIPVGFQGIEHPSMRTTLRVPGQDVPHVFAESLYSLGEYRSLRSLCASGEIETLEGYLWRHYSNTPSSTYYVSATGPLN